jgi:hypothetical protein
MTLIDRARKYVALMPAAVSGGGGHNATFAVACVLVKGFDLSVDEARAVMGEYNARCDPPWHEKDLEHKLTQAERVADAQPRGYLKGAGYEERGSVSGMVTRARPLPVEKPEYKPEVLREFAGELAREVDLVWLANRSAVDPATVTQEGFLKALYRSGEKVLMFNECNREGMPITQGEAVWPDDAPLTRGKWGVWYLAQPVDGKAHVNPRGKTKTGEAKMSRRSEEAVLRFPYLVLESDEAPLREWLGALVQFPLCIEAIYTSGGRSVHALVRVDAANKKQWDEIKQSLMPGFHFMIKAGLDRGVLSAVRLSRLPGAVREGKAGVDEQGRVFYKRYEKPELQKLLYLAPGCDNKPICERRAVRDVVAGLIDRVGAFEGAEALDLESVTLKSLRRELRYYARVNHMVRRLAMDLEREIERSQAK